MKRKVFFMFMAGLLGCTCFVGCGKQSNVKDSTAGVQEKYESEPVQLSSGEILTFTDNANAGSSEVIEYTMISGKTGEDEGAPYFTAAVERFNEYFEGKFHVTLEGSTNYEEKMEQLVMSGNIPSVYEYGSNDFVKNNIIPNHQYFDLQEFFEKNPWILETAPESAVTYVKNGEEFVCAPNPIVSTTGVWYNGKKYQPSKDIADMTWEEFTADLGDNKLALQTGDGCYQVDLLIPALLAEEEGGIEMMEAGKKENVSDFSTDIWKNVFQRVKDIYQQVGWQGGIGDNYAAAANSLFSNESSVIFNGIWMTINLTEDASGYWSNGFDGADMEVTMYPNNIAVGNPDKYTWFVNPNIDSEQLALAEAWIGFYYSQDEIEERLLALGGQAPTINEYSEEFTQKLKEDRWNYQMSNAINAETVLVPEFYYFCTNTSMLEMSKLLPSLLDESMSVDEFCDAMTRKAQDALDE